MTGVPERRIELTDSNDYRTYREIVYRERQDVGYLAFDFYNGAMSTEQCHRLRKAYRYACAQSTKVIVLLGGRSFFSNGIHLNVIEAARDSAAESWANIHAIDDLVHDIIETSSHLVVAALRGNAGAGGAMMALASDRVIRAARCGPEPTLQRDGRALRVGVPGPIPCRGAWAREHRMS